MAGGLLFQARNELGLSQRDFSQLVGTAPATLSRVENGLQDPSLGTLLKILDRGGFRLEVALVQVESQFGPKASSAQKLGVQKG
jgi:transcriptional regulator with XRE-family HTH domain